MNYLPRLVISNPLVSSPLGRKVGLGWRVVGVGVVGGGFGAGLGGVGWWGSGLGMDEVSPHWTPEGAYGRHLEDAGPTHPGAPLCGLGHSACCATSWTPGEDGNPNRSRRGL